MKDLTNQQWRDLTGSDEQAVIIDVRTDEEIFEGKIPGAMAANVMEPPVFMEKVQELDKNKNYYVYCKSGGRSRQACAVLNYLGFTNVYNLTDGFSNWDGDVE